jgi:hypothetical protein
MTPNRVLAQLQKYQNLNAKTYIEHICPDEDSTPDTAHTYLKIFALLILQNKGEEIVEFVKEIVSDQRLPLCQRPRTQKGSVDLGCKDSPEQALQCLQNFETHEREIFEENQWKVLVPFFDLDKNFMARHYELDDSTILPWCKKDERSISSSQSSQKEGGFAYVIRVKIDPSSHGFRDVLRSVCFPPFLGQNAIPANKIYRSP